MIELNHKLYQEMKMSSHSSYGQFCPLSMAAEFLCKRWTMLILRELILGSRSFNDISRGVSRMSRTLLSERLNELISLRIIIKIKSLSSHRTKYNLTPAGQALSSVIFSMADWGQEWLETEPALEDIEADHLLWSIRRNACPHPALPSPFIAEIYLVDQPENRTKSWLIFEDKSVDLCIIDRDFDVDVQIKSTAATLTKVWMGWSDFNDEVNTGQLKLFGEKKYTSIAKQWLGESRLAKIKKQPSELLVP